MFHTFSGYAYLMTRAPCCLRSYSTRSLDCNYEAHRLCNNIMLSAFDHSCTPTGPGTGLRNPALQQRSEAGKP
jgi:hypothetical protein